MDRLAQRKEVEIGLSGKRFEVPLSKSVLQVFFILIILIFVFLFARTFQMQVLEGKDYSAKAQENKFLISQIQAERGVVYDQNMEQLVYNDPSFDLVASGANLPEGADMEKELQEISEIIGLNVETIKEKIESGNTILEDIPHDQLIILKTRIKEFPGFEINQSWVRNYKDSEYFSHIIGYLGKITSSELNSSDEYSISDWVGRAGLEKSYEEVLRKDPGELQIERDALGNELSQSVIEQPQSGDSLVLWLDADLQRKVADVLENTLKNIGSQSAATVILDVETGGVLSLASVPSFDNNLFNKGSDQEKLNELIKGTLANKSLYNLAIAGQFPSGSTIKPLIAAAILQEGITTAEKSIYCEGKIEIKNSWGLPSTIKHDWAVHGWTDIRKAIAESCDVYFYIFGGGF